MKRLPLHDAHLKHGAVLQEANGLELPAHYGDWEAEHQAVRQAVGISDLSHRGLVRVTGEDRLKWLHGITSNDLLTIPSGTARYTALLSHKGRMLSYVRVYPLADSVLLEDAGEIGDATFQALRKFLLYGTKAKLENLAERWGALLVSGPRAPELIQSAFNLDVGHLTPLQFIVQQTNGQHAVLIRSEETGEIDLELLLPVDGLTSAWERLWESGERMGVKPVGLRAREALRIEAGLPRAGAELTEEIVPPEANLQEKGFSLSKGCYPGQEALARMDTYGNVRRRLVSLVLHEPLVVSKGAKLFSGSREVGWVSSATHSPSFGCTVALGFPLRDFATPGTSLDVEIDGQRHEATVRPFPLYSSV